MLVIVPLVSEAVAVILTLEPAETLLPLAGFVIETTGCGVDVPQIKLEQVPPQQSEL